MTNSANSDGRWPPPPRVTCAFNREWCLDEIKKTRAVLDELKELTQGMPLPSEEEYEAPPPDDWRYGYEFTTKDPTDVKNLNRYELMHAVFYANKMAECNLPDKKEEGTNLLRDVFDELDRRGMKGVRPPVLRGEKINKMWSNESKDK